MTSGGQNGGPRQVARSLAGELRAVIAALAGNEVPEDRLEAALVRAAELRELLDGPRRARWYDGAGVGEQERLAYLDLSPVRGQLNPVAPPLVVAGVVCSEDGTPTLEATATLGPAYEGPPHGVHGGWVAALFDDLLGQAQGLVGKTGMTATLSVRYRAITPLGEPLRLTAWIDEDRGRRVKAKASCHAGDTLTADAEAVFLSVDFGEIASRTGGS